MSGFRFFFAELLRETMAINTMAKGFLDSNSIYVLDLFKIKLENLENQEGERVRTLDITGLRTVPSRDYETDGRKGGQNVHAVVSGVWEMRPLGLKKVSGRQVEFCGKASTVVKLYASDEPSKPLAVWQFDLGADDAPGCYVHAQIPWGSNMVTPYQKPIPIPRLPSIFVTPMSAVEFVLGELFQDKWSKETAQNTSDAQRWRSLQQERLHRLFSWYKSRLGNSVSSPWMALKAAKPDGKEFVAE